MVGEALVEAATQGDVDCGFHSVDPWPFEQDVEQPAVHHVHDVVVGVEFLGQFGVPPGNHRTGLCYDSLRDMPHFEHRRMELRGHCPAGVPATSDLRYVQ